MLSNYMHDMAIGTSNPDCSLNLGIEQIRDVARLRTLWRHQMETFSPLLALCERNPPATSDFYSQKSVTRNFDVFFDLHQNTEQTAEKTIETLVIWHAIALIMTSR